MEKFDTSSKKERKMIKIKNFLVKNKKCIESICKQ